MINARRLPNVEGWETGMCPGCDGAGFLRFAAHPCTVCNGEGRILYDPKFTHREDEKLRSLLQAGRSLRFASVQLDRPLMTVKVHAAALGLEVQRSSP